MYRGILDGQASAGRFLELLANSRDEAVLVSREGGRLGRSGAGGVRGRLEETGMR